MDLSFDKSPSSSCQNCQDRQKTRQQFKEIISTTPRNSEWMSFVSLYEYQGFWYSDRFLEGTLLAQEQFKAQADDIFLCSTPKSGITWLKALAFAIMNRTCLDDSTNPLLSKVPHDIVPSLEVDLFSQHEKPVSYPKTPLWATHIPYTALPMSIVDSKCKIVYICRDPKDVLVSLWHYLGNVNSNGEGFPLEKAFKLFCEGVSLHGPYWDHVLGYWQACMKSPERVLFLTYEKLQTEASFNVRRLAQFLSCPFSLDEEKHGVVQKIIKLCSFENLKNLEVSKTREYSLCGSTTIENNKYFRKGMVGDWKNCLTKEMKDRIDQITEDMFRGSGLTF